jgi:hypothetical protein
VKARLAKTLGGALAALAIAGGALVAIPTAAQADGNCPIGDFCALADKDVGPFGWFPTPGSSTNWPASVKNRVDWVGNSGTNSGPTAVDIFYAASYGGAYACINRNTGWNLRGNDYHFNWRKNGNSSGWNQSVHDNAASHRWVYSCGDNNF